jgi:hypothetical protein
MQNAVLEIAEYSCKTFDQGAQAVGQVLSTTSKDVAIKDVAIEIQQNFAQSACRAYLSEMNRLGATCLGVALDAFRSYVPEGAIDSAPRALGAVVDAPAEATGGALKAP